MMRSARFAIVGMLMAVALSCTACGATNQTQTDGVEVQEPKTVALEDEGVDTLCVVDFSPYAGSHKEMFLKAGDSIAVISPSSMPSRAQVDITVEGLKSWGYVPVLGEHVREPVRTLADCVEDLTWALEDPDTRAIFCVRGGYGASEVMDEIPQDLIAESGKLIIGYSDITVFHSAWTSAGLPSVHASMSATFDDLVEVCVDAEQRLLLGEVPTYSCATNGYCRKGEAEGVLIGGNLSTFTSVLGTAYDCSQTDEPYILFLEDVAEDLQHIHRYLATLEHLGVLDKAQGIVFGEWTDFPAAVGDYGGNSRGGTFTSVANMIAREFMDDLDVPVAFGFPAGHGAANYPLLMGERVHLKVGDTRFTLDWPGVSQD